MAPGSLTGLVLAAGAGTRLGGPKADVLVGGRRLLDRAVMPFAQVGFGEIIAVVREGIAPVDGARCVVNPDPDRGMGSSLRCGLDAATGDGVVIVLVDQIGITGQDLLSVVEAASGDRIMVARRGGHRSHPVLVPRSRFEDFAAAATGDRGGRRLLDSSGSQVVFVDLPDVMFDVDTADDLERARSVIEHL